MNKLKNSNDYKKEIRKKSLIRLVKGFKESKLDFQK